MNSSGRLVWRVNAQDGTPCADAFDAAVLIHASPPALQRGLALPHESERADEPLALIVRARVDAPPIVVECEVFAADGAMVVRGLATDQEVVIIRSPYALEVRDELPAGEPDPFATAT
jgi:hypothetical protein